MVGNDPILAERLNRILMSNALVTITSQVEFLIFQYILSVTITLIGIDYIILLSYMRRIACEDATDTLKWRFLCLKLRQRE
jgi:hypothetical protein